MNEKPPAVRGNASRVDAFLAEMTAVRQLKPAPSLGRLIFALDATASREPTWRWASRLQAQMFEVAAEAGGLAIQLCYYRGFDGFETLPWHTTAQALRTEMERIGCVSGYTQVDRVLRHALAEHRRERVNALVFIGDAWEEDEEPLFALAGQLGLQGVRVFMFQEGDDPGVETVFRGIARLSGGAYARFDAGSPDRLARLLRAVAVYAAGGIRSMQALAGRGDAAIPELTRQLRQP
ncbi:VWA domain-containing protein [Methylococcus geothermalis]|uniref:VWA domain-containing protein n=1 Tax=Methylococcus geothermalis TaxID=2681310 RepID=A0A858Q9G9_9GAMM|nr:VWA domain-containing protein [Methylococcus geothermalis]QJD30519.1 VWA domain-containing protein [Methylococcus geothermalis]